MRDAELKEMSDTYAEALENAAAFVETQQRSSPRVVEAVCYALRHKAEMLRLPEFGRIELANIQKELERQLQEARNANMALIGLVNRALTLAAVPERNQDSDWYAESEAIGKALLEVEGVVMA